MKEEAIAAAKAAPPVFITGATVFGYALNDVVALLTLVYVVLQIAFLLIDRSKKRKESKR